MPSVGRLLSRITRTLYLFGDESGGLETQPYFLLGVLLARSPERHERQIYVLRQAHRYYNELKYAGTDKYKPPFAKAVIDYFFREPDLRFVTTVVDNAQYDLAQYEKFDSRIRPRDVAYNYRYKRLILSCTPARDDLVVILDDRTRAKEDNLPEYLAAEIPNMKSLQLVDSKKHQLVQVADLLTGSVYGALTRSQHPVKRAIIDHLKGRLRVESFRALALRDDEKFRVDLWKAPRDREEED